MVRVPRKNWLEWTVFAVGLLCIGVVVGLLGYSAMRASSSPPDIVVRLGEPEARGEWTHVLVSLTNRGGSAAADVQVELVAEGDGHVASRSSIQVDLLPREGTRDVQARFAGPPPAGMRVRVSALTFGIP